MVRKLKGVIMKRTAVFLTLTALSLSAVEVRQDYFPLAVGNEWHYKNYSLQGDQLLTHRVVVTGIEDTTFTIMKVDEHPFIDFSMPQRLNVSLSDDGVVSGFGSSEGVYRNYYFNDDTYKYSAQPESLIARDTFFLANRDTTFTNVWGIDPWEANLPKGEMFAQGIGILGFDMDFSTEEYYEVGHGGFQLDSMKIVPKPSVITAESVGIDCMTSMDSSFSVNIISDSTLEIQYLLTTALYENTVVSSSYDEINNTLRIWLVDTLTLLDGMMIKLIAPEPGGYEQHTLQVKDVDISSDLNIAIFHENRINAFHTMEVSEISRPNPVILFRETYSHAVVVEPIEVRNRQALSHMSVNEGVISLQEMQNRSGILRIQNLRGQEISRMDVQGEQIIPLSNQLAQGMYIVSLESFAGVENIKIVVQ